MLGLRFFVAGLALAFASSGCSALIDPDVTRLGGGPSGDGGGVEADGGGSGTDAGPGSDGGLRDDGSAHVDAGPGDDAGPGCSTPTRCSGNSLVACSGGAETTTPCALGCITDPSPHCGVMVPSNVGETTWDPGAADLQIEESNATYDTTACANLGAVRASIVDQPDAPQLCVLFAGAVRVTPGGRLQVVGSRPLVVLANDEARIEGTIDVSARLVRPGPGGFGGGNATANDGAGPAGGIAGEHQGLYSDGGGGGGGACGVGGRGGDSPMALFSSTPTALGGEGGGPIDASWELSPLFGGSGGGRGRGTIDSSGASGGFGGAGGGALQIASAVRVRLSGSILAGGGGGAGGTNRGIGDNWGSGGAGGAGGAVLLEAPEIRFDPGGRVVVTGGGGGAGVVSGVNGPNGQDGYLAPTGRAAGGTSAGLPSGTVSDGGDGAGADALAGERGLDSTPEANGGGGGGGAGCALFRTADSTLMGGATVNPGSAPASRILRIRVR